MANNATSATAPTTNGTAAPQYTVKYLKEMKYIQITNVADGSKKIYKTIPKPVNIKKCKNIEAYMDFGPGKTFSHEKYLDIQAKCHNDLSSMLCNVAIPWSEVSYEVWQTVIDSVLLAHPILHWFIGNWAPEMLMKRVCWHKRDTYTNKCGRLRKRKARSNNAPSGEEDKEGDQDEDQGPEEDPSTVGKGADKPTDEPTDKPADEPTNKPADEPTNEPADEPTNEPADEPADEPTDGTTDRTTDGTTDELPGEPANDRVAMDVDKPSSNADLGSDSDEDLEDGLDVFCKPNTSEVPQSVEDEELRSSQEDVDGEVIVRAGKSSRMVKLRRIEDSDEEEEPKSPVPSTLRTSSPTPQIVQTTQPGPKGGLSQDTDMAIESTAPPTEPETPIPTVAITTSGKTDHKPAASSKPTASSKPAASSKPTASSKPAALSKPTTLSKAKNDTPSRTPASSKGPNRSVPPEGPPTAVQKKKATQGMRKGPGKATTAAATTASESSQATTSAKNKRKANSVIEPEPEQPADEPPAKRPKNDTQGKGKNKAPNRVNSWERKSQEEIARLASTTAKEKKGKSGRAAPPSVPTLGATSSSNPVVNAASATAFTTSSTVPEDQSKPRRRPKLKARTGTSLEAKSEMVEVFDLSQVAAPRRTTRSAVKK